MAIDPTLMETNLRRSIKKFFLDGIMSGESIPVWFDRTVSPPDTETDRWVNVKLQTTMPRTVSVGSVDVYMFSKNDLEGDQLADLRDKVLNLLYPRNIDLYDGSWNKIGGIQVTIEEVGPQRYNPDGSKMSSMGLTLRWGAKW